MNHNIRNAVNWGILYLCEWCWEIGTHSYSCLSQVVISPNINLV